MRRWEELRSFHESGHAVAGARGGRTVYALTIVPDPSCQVGTSGLYFLGGQCRFGEAPEDEPNPSPVKKLETDEYRAVRLAFCFVAGLKPPRWKAALAVIREYRAKSEALLIENWYTVQALAGELERRRTLNQSEIAAILGRV